MSNELIPISELSTRIGEIIEKAMDDAGLTGEERIEATIEALDWLNRSLGGPGVERR